MRREHCFRPLIRSPYRGRRRKTWPPPAEHLGGPRETKGRTDKSAVILSPARSALRQLLGEVFLGWFPLWSLANASRFIAAGRFGKAAAEFRFCQGGVSAPGRPCLCLCEGSCQAVLLKNTALMFLEVDRSSVDTSMLVWFLSYVPLASIPALQRAPVGWGAPTMGCVIRVLALCAGISVGWFF